MYKMVYSKLLISILAVLALRYTLADTEKDDAPVKSRMCYANTQYSMLTRFKFVIELISFKRRTKSEEIV